MTIKRRRRTSLGNRLGMWGIVIVVVVLIVTMLNQSSELKRKNASYVEQEATLREQIEIEEQRSEEIANMKDEMRTKEYIESIAKEKLGLVYPGELVFRSSN